MWSNIFGALFGQEVTMADLPTNERNALANKVFGLPEKRAYPMPDANHARNAKARAAEEFNRGNLSAAERDRIDRKADEILAQR
jgi:hypothetical protein